MDGTQVTWVFVPGGAISGVFTLNGSSVAASWAAATKPAGGPGITPGSVTLGR